MDQTLSYSPERITYQTVMEVLGFIDRGMVLKLLEKLVAGDMAAVMDMVEQLHVGGHDMKQFYKKPSGRGPQPAGAADKPGREPGVVRGAGRAGGAGTAAVDDLHPTG